MALILLITVESSATFSPTFAQEENPEDGVQTCEVDLPDPTLYLAFVASLPIPEPVASLPIPLPRPALGMMMFDGSQWGAMPEPIPDPAVAPFSPAMAFDSSSGVLLMASTVNMEPTGIEANILMRTYDGSEWSATWLPPTLSTKGVNPSLVCGFLGEGDSSVFRSYLFWEDRSTAPSSIRYTNLLAEVPSYSEFPHGEQPTAAIYNGELFLSYVRGDTLVYRVCTFPEVWSDENPYGAMPEPIPHPTHPSMTVGAMPEPIPHPVLYLAYNDEVDRIYYHTFDGTSWSSASQLGNYGDLLPSGPALCTFNDRLCMFYKSDGHVYYQILDGEWSAPTLVAARATIRIGIYPGSSSVQYVSSSDYVYVKHGWTKSANWSSVPANEQNAFLDPQQCNFTLQTSAPSFQNPPLTHQIAYHSETDGMDSWFFYQFYPGDLAPGTYSFTGTWSATALANPPAGGYLHNTITLVVVTPVPLGENVTVDPASDLELTFSSVTAEGYAWTDKTSTAEAPLLPDLVGQYYDTSVTSDYSGNVTASLTYDDSNMTQQQESSLQMMQYTPIAGDIVNYGEVNILDISFVAKCFGTTSASPSWNATADINEDGNINILDITRCAVNFGETTEWTNITTYVDTELNIVHGETTHFSMFGVTCRH